MGVLDVIVVLHGAVLLTGAAGRLGSASGPLMIAYAVVMLLTQAVLGTGMMAAGSGIGMGMESGMGGSTMSAGMGWDAGMVFLAALMLVSGIIMTRNGSMATSSGGM